MSIEYHEILKGKYLDEIDPKHRQNIEILYYRINILREAYGMPMTVTSGYRSPADQLRIYRAKGIAKDKVPMRSRHLTGEAIDIYDPKGRLWKWCLENLALIQRIGLWLEHPNWTHKKDGSGWVHFQCSPPKSKKRIFVPFAGPDPNPEFWNGKYNSKFDEQF